MFIRFARILMQKADAPAGGGQIPPSSQAEATAQPGANPPAAQPDMAALVKDVVGQVRDSMFAELRKAGVLGGGKSGGKGDPPAGEAPPASTGQGVSLDEVQAMVTRESAYARALGAASLTPEQEGLVQTLYKAAKPDDPAGFVAATLKTLGIGARSDSTNQMRPATNQRPVSDAGGPAPSSQPGGAPTLLKMSEADRADWLRERGPVAFRQQLQKELRGASVKVRDR